MNTPQFSPLQEPPPQHTIDSNLVAEMFRNRGQWLHGDDIGWVYCFHNERAGLWKIGFSTRPRHRWRELCNSTGCHLRICWVCPGDERVEAELHRRLRDRRQHGEWFVLTEREADGLLQLMVDHLEDAAVCGSNEN